MKKENLDRSIIISWFALQQRSSRKKHQTTARIRYIAEIVWCKKDDEKPIIWPLAHPYTQIHKYTTRKWVIREQRCIYMWIHKVIACSVFGSIRIAVFPYLIHNLLAFRQRVKLPIAHHSVSVYLLWLNFYCRSFPPCFVLFPSERITNSII